MGTPDTDLFIKKVPGNVKALIVEQADLHRRSINQEAIVLLEEALAGRLRSRRSPRHEVREIIRRYQALPVQGKQTPEEFIGYDADGLPR